MKDTVPKFKPGDAVRASTGGPIMTVSVIEEGIPGSFCMPRGFPGAVTCRWLDDQGEECSKEFEEHELELAVAE